MRRLPVSSAFHFGLWVGWFPDAASCIVKHSAAKPSVLRTRLHPAYEERFKASSIDLTPDGSQTRLAFYEAGHAFGIRYSKAALPNENDLVSDLLHMLALYERVTALGGSQELDTTGQVVTQPGEEGSTDASLEEKRQLRFHYRIERNRRLARLAKEVHG